MLGKISVPAQEAGRISGGRGKRIEIAGTWTLRGKEAGFRIGTYDREQPLVIDPVLYYATYLGGNGLVTGFATRTCFVDSNGYPLVLLRLMCQGASNKISM